MIGKVFVLLTFVTLCAHQCRTSGIPMWEYLSRDEKMNHLYSMFAKQVQSYCKNQNNENVSQCKMNMMMHGVNKLNDMEESHLDAMDPYQRNANNILWDSMMNGQNDQMKSDERQKFLQKEQFKQQNPLFKDDAANDEETTNLGSDQYDDDEQNNYLHQGAATNHVFAYVNKPNELDNQEVLEQNTNYLINGMVQWMMPDGSPVIEKIPFTLPVDDDRDDMTMGKKRMPTMKELYETVKTMDEEPKIIFEIPPTTNASPSTAVPTRMIKTLYGNYRIAERVR